jgi:TonB family protein
MTGELRQLRSGLSGSTTIEAPGTGGEAYASYDQVVKTIYTEAWIPPDETIDELTTVQVRVTIARDGSVVADRSAIVKRSGVPALDRSIEEVLRRVRFVAPFPEGATDLERVYLLHFNLKLKRAFG